MRPLRLFLPIALLSVIFVSSSSTPSARSLSVDKAMVETPVEPDLELPSHSGLEKRRGGGGGGGRGGGGGSRGGGGRGGRSGSSTPPSYSSSSNVGGETVKGSGTPRTYTGSSNSVYYRGGAAVPFTALKESPRGITPVGIELAAVAGIYAGFWGAGVAAYIFAESVSFFNVTSQRDEALPALCLCQVYLVCGCDKNRDSEYLNRIANEASSTSDFSRVSIVNGTLTLVINGTLANGTTSPGGTDPSSAGALHAGGTLMRSLGVWLMAGAIQWGVLFL